MKRKNKSHKKRFFVGFLFLLTGVSMGYFLYFKQILSQDINILIMMIGMFGGGFFILLGIAILGASLMKWLDLN